jgi:hypothetical protein
MITYNVSIYDKESKKRIYSLTGWTESFARAYREYESWNNISTPKKNYRPLLVMKDDGIISIMKPATDKEIRELGEK